jgi:hypothetical protein
MVTTGSLRKKVTPIKARIDPKSVGEVLKRRRVSPDIHRQRGSIPPDGA